MVELVLRPTISLLTVFSPASFLSMMRRSTLRDPSCLIALGVCARKFVSAESVAGSNGIVCESVVACAGGSTGVEGIAPGDWTTGASGNVGKHFIRLNCVIQLIGDESVAGDNCLVRRDGVVA
jgi:hypothetical protein